MRKSIETFGVIFDELNFLALTGIMQVTRRQLRNRNSAMEKLALLESYRDKPVEEIFPEPEFVPPFSRMPWQRPPQLTGVGRGYVMERLTFLSAVHSGHPENDTVVAWWLYRPGFETAPTILHAHGWMAYDPGLWLRLPLSWAEGPGYNVLMLELPFHMSRTPAGTRSGELSITSDLPASFITARQGVSDMRVAIRWLRQQGVKKVGLLGKSLGGLLCALTTVAEPDIDCTVLLIPAVDAGVTLWHSTYTRLVKADLIRQGIDEALTSRTLAVTNPTNYRPAIDPERVLIVEATADRACFPADTEKLAAAWGCPIERIPLGHLSASLSNQARYMAQGFMIRWMQQ